MFRIVLIALSALGGLFQSGCASVSVAHAPAEFDLGRARIDAAGAAPPGVSSGPHGKVAGAAAGGAAGAVGVGIGAGVIAAVPCIFLGPFAAPCFAAVAPAAATGALIGGVTGATVGAVATKGADSPEEAAAKREVLDLGLAGLAVRELLVERLQRRAREVAKIELPVVDPSAQGHRAAWRIAVETIHIEPSQTGSDDRYALIASASVAVRNAESGEVVFERRYQAVSPERRTSAEWGNDSAAAARATLDNLTYALAHQIFSNLSRDDLTTAGLLWTRAHHVNKSEFLGRRTSAIIAKVDDTERRDGPPIQLRPGRYSVEVAYRRESYLCGYLGCVDFEQKRAVFELRVEAGRSYMPFAIRHCDRDWMGIVDTGKSAKDDLASWQAIGGWQFGDLTRETSTHVVAAGELPPVMCKS